MLSKGDGWSESEKVKSLLENWYTKTRERVPEEGSVHVDLEPLKLCSSNYITTPWQYSRSDFSTARDICFLLACIQRVDLTELLVLVQFNCDLLMPCYLPGNLLGHTCTLTTWNTSIFHSIASVPVLTCADELNFFIINHPSSKVNPAVIYCFVLAFFSFSVFF